MATNRMFVVLLDRDPVKSVEYMDPYQRYTTIDSIAECVNYAMDIINPRDIDKARINLKAWKGKLSTMCLYGIQLGETLVKRPDLASRMSHLDNLMKSNTVDFEDGESPWPYWIDLEKQISSSRGYVVGTGSLWYEQFDWFDKVTPINNPYSWVS